MYCSVLYFTNYKYINEIRQYSLSFALCIRLYLVYLFGFVICLGVLYKHPNKIKNNNKRRNEMVSRCSRCGKAYESSADLREHDCSRHITCDDCGCENDFYASKCWYCNSDNLTLVQDTEEPQKEVK